MKFIRELRKNEFYRNVFTLFSGSTIAQSVPFLITPILTRIYPETQFGLFFLFMSIILTLSSSACLQYDAAIVLPKDDTDALHLIALCGIISVMFSLLTGIVLYIFSDQLAHLLNNAKIKEYFFLVPIGVFILGINQAFTAWNNRKKQYGFISITNVSRASTTAAIQTGAKYIKCENFGLVSGTLIGQATALIIQILKFFSETGNLIKILSFKRMFHVAGQYKRMPVFNTISNLLNNLSNHLPIFLLTRFFGVSSASYYGISNRIVATPMGLIGQSVSQVFIQNAAEAHHLKQDLNKLLKKMYGRLLKIAVIPFTILFLFSPFVFKLILGKEWDSELAGNITRILIPWLLVMFLNSPLMSIVNILQKQSAVTIYSFVLLLFRFLSIYLGYTLTHNLLFALFLFSLTGLIFNVFILFYLLKVSKDGVK
jgi:lipopolysaccharide exporter